MSVEETAIIVQRCNYATMVSAIQEATLVAKIRQIYIKNLLQNVSGNNIMGII